MFLEFWIFGGGASYKGAEVGETSPPFTKLVFSSLFFHFSFQFFMNSSLCFLLSASLLAFSSGSRATPAIGFLTWAYGFSWAACYSTLGEACFFIHSEALTFYLADWGGAIWTSFLGFADWGGCTLVLGTSIAGIYSWGLGVGIFFCFSMFMMFCWTFWAAILITALMSVPSFF